MKAVRVGLVGLGALGKVHAQNLMYRIPNAILTAVCTRTQTKQDEVRREWETPEIYTNFSDMLAHAQLDAVVIVSPTNVHLEHVRMAVEHGLAVFIEKPTGMDMAECAEIERLAAVGGKQFAVGFMRRFDVSYADAKQRIEAGEIGTPIFFRGYSLDPIWQGEAQVARAQANGRWFLDMGVHDYDLARWLLGAEAVEAYACGGAYVFDAFAKNHDVDNGFSLVRFDSGAAAFFYCGRTAPHGSHVESEIVGTKGTLRICESPRRARVTQFTSAGEVHECINHYLDRWSEAYYQELQEFINEVQEGTQSVSATAADCTHAVGMAELILSAYKAQHSVHVSEVDAAEAR